MGRVCRLSLLREVKNRILDFLNRMVRERERVAQGRKAKVGGSVRKQNMAGEEEEKKGREGRGKC